MALHGFVYGKLNLKVIKLLQPKNSEEISMTVYTTGYKMKCFREEVSYKTTYFHYTKAGLRWNNFQHKVEGEFLHNNTIILKMSTDGSL